MVRLARRMDFMDSSGIRKVFDLAADLKDPVNLSIGQPDFDVPDAARDEAIRAIRQGFNRYTVTQGIPELRDRVRDEMKRTRNWEPGEVFITCGVSGGLVLAILALVDDGDEVLIPDPYFVMYKHLGRFAGGRAVYVDTYPDFRLTPERLEKVITKRSKILFVNSPANPTGAVYEPDDLKGVAELCRRHDITVISDEVYSDFCYDGPFTSITRYLPETLLLSGFSKSYAFTGWRLGYACGPKAILQKMLTLQQYTFVCAPSMVQQAGVVALDCDNSDLIATFKRKRDMVWEGLKDHFELTRPGGAFYVFPRAPRGTGQEFVERVIARNCLVIPGSVFSEKDTHFRISYATSEEKLRQGIEILKSLA